MKNRQRCEAAANQPLEIALAASKPIDGTLRQTLSVAEFDSIRREMLGGLIPQHDFDDLDLEIDQHLQVDPYAGDPPSRRSDKEINRVLSILDSLEERGSH